MNKCICVFPYMTNGVTACYQGEMFRYKSVDNSAISSEEMFLARYDYCIYFDKDILLPNGTKIVSTQLISKTFKKHFVNIDEYRNNKIEEIIK